MTSITSVTPPALHPRRDAVVGGALTGAANGGIFGGGLGLFGLLAIAGIASAIHEPLGVRDALVGTGGAVLAFGATGAVIGAGIGALVGVASPASFSH